MIETAYEQKGVEFSVYESDKDFFPRNKPNAVSIFKLHGSIDCDFFEKQDRRIILTDNDYDQTSNFREGIYDRFKSDLLGATLIIIGHSLSDEHIKEIANRHIEVSSKSGNLGKAILLIYERDENRARLWEKRGFQVTFGGIDDFIAAITKNKSIEITPKKTSSIIEKYPLAQTITLDVKHDSEKNSDFTGMFNGWPATYSDIIDGLTFDRTLSGTINSFFDQKENLCAVILGPSGVGKTTTARKIILHYSNNSFNCWEHKNDFDLPSRDWINIAIELKELGESGIILIDEGHNHLYEINNLIDGLIAQQAFNLKIIICSTRNHWNPRVKSVGFYKISKEFSLGKLKTIEIDSLLTLIDSNQKIRRLVEESFSGFARHERKRRLLERCESETFVCLKNVFSSEKFEDIILREYASLDSNVQDVYKFVAAMESSGIKVHRQLIIRLLGIPANHINSILGSLTDIVNEYVIDERQGIYGWKSRHNVIASILTKYKFPEIESLIRIFENVIDSISPTYDIEIRTIRELCNLDTGIPRIPDRSIQNRLLRKMISNVPSERVPRHRLISNLIKIGEFEQAETEIRIFEKDFGRDAPVLRYKILCLIARANESNGILSEDRLSILKQAKEMAQSALNKHEDNKLILGTYCEVGVQIYKNNKDYSIYEEALKKLKEAESRVGDPQISALVRKYEQRFSGQAMRINETTDNESLDSDFANA